MMDDNVASEIEEFFSEYSDDETRPSTVETDDAGDSEVATPPPSGQPSGREFFLNSAAVLADTFAKLGITAPVNEMFEALLRDMGIPYSFPYKRWTDFLKPPVKAEAERLCRVSDSLEKQESLMNYCIKNDLVDRGKVDDNYRLNATQYVQERLNFFLSRVKSLTSFSNLARVLGADSKGQPLRGRVTTALWQGVVNRYLPTDEQIVAAIRSRFAVDEPQRAAALCFWKSSPGTLCKRIAKLVDTADMDRLATSIISRARQYVSPFPSKKVTTYTDEQVISRPAPPPVKRRGLFGRRG